MQIRLDNVYYDYGGPPVLGGVTQEINPGDRVGIVGPNGSGKTTLIQLIEGTVAAVQGSVIRQPETTIGTVPQHLETLDAKSVGEFLLGDILQARRSLRAIESEMSELGESAPDEVSRVLNRYQTLREPYDRQDGDSAESRAARILSELGIPDALDRTIETLSGGERNVLGLAKAIMTGPEVLVLDEPGNHLDFAGLAWLESYLGSWKGALLIVSHNRYLLDKVCTRIWELSSGQVTSFTGNYSDYRFSRLTQAISDQAVWTVQQKALSRLENLVRTFEERARVTGDPAWGKRLRARRSQLAKAREFAMEKPDIVEESISVQFNTSKAKADIAVQLRDYSRRFGDLILFANARMLVRVGERVGIVGPNGSGKTTLLKDIVGEGDWNNPVLRVGPSLRIGYCAQHRDRFSADTTVHDAMLTAGNHTRNEVFGVLGRLLFVWEDLERPVSTLSGGEWNRLQLGIAMIRRANLLILDEPTNHLDIQSREAVEDALREFAGTIVAVSHDRYFLDAIATRIISVENQDLVSAGGSFTEYWASRPNRGPIRNASLSTRGRHVTGRRGGQTNDGGGKKRAHGHDAAIERDILRLEEQQRDLEQKMTTAFETGAHARGRSLARDLEKVRSRLEDLYERWGES